MRFLANCVVPLAIGLCGLGALAAVSTANAQSAAQADAQSTPASPAVYWHAADPPATLLYQDRFIGGGSLAPDITKTEEGFSDSQGLARSLQIDGVVSALGSHDSGSSSNVVENGIVAKA
jgi:hypothetical protein